MATSARDRPVDLVLSHRASRGAELGVWRGERAWRLLDETSIEELVLIDPWLEELNRFPIVGTGEQLARMPAGLYHCMMGEPHRTQPELDAMWAEVERRAADYGKRCRVLRMEAAEAAGLFPNASLDFVLVDGIHLEGWVLATLRDWAVKVRPGGFIGGDGLAEIGVRRAVHAHLGRAKVDPAEDFWWQTL